MTRKDKILFGFSVIAIFAMASCGGGSGSGGGNKENPTPTVSVKCTTGEAYAITEAAATITGSVTISNAKATSATVVFYYAGGTKTASALKDTGTKVQAGTVGQNGGTFSITLSGLESGTTYSYVAVATIDNKEALGSVRTFKTTAVSETGAASAIKANSATLTGTFIQPTGASGTFEYGFVYGTDSTPQIGNAGCTAVVSTSGLNSNKQYTVEVTDLSPATTYYYRSYAKNGTTWYGEVKNFKTANLNASVATLEASGISTTAATLSGRLTINSQGNFTTTGCFYYSTTAQTAADLKAVGTEVAGTWGTEGNFSAQITDLTKDTKYYFVAEATVAGVTFTGSVKNFTTAAQAGNPDDWGNDGGKIEFTPKN